MFCLNPEKREQGIDDRTGRRKAIYTITNGGLFLARTVYFLSVW